MKIGIVGTHGVGKTYLCKELGSILQIRGHTHEVVEVARVIQDKGLTINEKATVDDQLAILTSQIWEELLLEKKLESSKCMYGITDRTVPDNLAYMELAARRDPKYGHIPKEIFNFAGYWCREHPYDIIFKPELWSIPKKDKTRSENIGFQREIDKVVDELFEKFGLKYEVVPGEYFTMKDEEEQKITFLRYFKEKLNLEDIP